MSETDAAPDGPRDRRHHRRRSRGARHARRPADRRLRGRGRVHPPVLLPRAHGPGGHVPHVPGRGRHRSGTGAAAQLHARRRARDDGVHRLAGHQEGPGRGARVPPHQPPPRLPGVRQGWGVPAPGPDHVPWSRREPLHRGEAALREADPHQRQRLPRPRALHPLRSLHPVRQRGGRRPADPLHRPGQPDRGQHLPRPRLRLVLQRQRRADLPGRCPHGQGPTGSRPGPGTSKKSCPPTPTPWATASRSSRRATRCCGSRVSTATR